jgi:hypothetical protein
MFLNYRFVRPGRINPAGHGFMSFPGSDFPFAQENQTDPFRGCERRLVELADDRLRRAMRQEDGEHCS